MAAGSSCRPTTVLRQCAPPFSRTLSRRSPAADGLAPRGAPPVRSTRRIRRCITMLRANTTNKQPPAFSRMGSPQLPIATAAPTGRLQPTLPSRSLLAGRSYRSCQWARSSIMEWVVHGAPWQGEILSRRGAWKFHLVLRTRKAQRIEMRSTQSQRTRTPRFKSSITSVPTLPRWCHQVRSRPTAGTGIRRTGAAPAIMALRRMALGRARWRGTAASSSWTSSMTPSSTATMTPSPTSTSRSSEQLVQSPPPPLLCGRMLHRPKLLMFI
mmetsp:Transcript_20844/g.57837  ORF Transcript_20844/g.57837 Transcript_20844/m.57837 type:complete len:269 (+) Transcript_20844:2178-2984(+)